MRNNCIRKRISILLASVMTLTCFGVIPSTPAEAETTARAAVLQDTGSREINFNTDWRFTLDEQENMQAEGVNYDDSAWEDVHIPHDFNIARETSNQYEAESGFWPGGIGWYRKSVVFPAEYATKTLVLNFDGVYNHAYVYVNGDKIGENHYGYNDFSFDITDHIICDGKTENVIAVKAQCAFPSSRWYSGAGIYRDVSLTVTDPVHVSKNGTYVTTPDLETQQDDDVDVCVSTTVQNDGTSSANISVRTTVLDAEGRAVSLPISDNVTVAAGAEEIIEQQTLVAQPALWSCEEPNLYYVKTEILSGNAVKDTYMTTFGFRYINYDADTGFSLNGQNMKLKGVCMHHDQGALGAAAYRDAIYRQVRILKEMGCNAIRTSHSTPADVLMDACNELGMMVMDETFDGWAYPKNGNSQDFSTHFNQTIGSDNHLVGAQESDTWYKFVLESNVQRDKNDPAVVMWDIGNELNFGVTDSSRYVEYATNMVQYIQAIDSTRPVTSGDNNIGGVNSGNFDFRNNITRLLATTGGIAGFNYYMGSLASVHAKYPDWKLVATETASPSNSRGIYDTTSSYGKNGDYQCTAYDTEWVSWGNSARESWYYTIKDDFVAGEFIWTGFDYIGEPTPWNGTAAGSVSGDSRPVPNSSYFGVIDTAGFPKDSFYFYTSQWRDDVTTLHVVPQSWNEEDLVVSAGKVPVYIYSDAAKVELYLNDELIGTSTRNVTTTAAGYEWATYTNESENSDLCTAVNDSRVWWRMAAQFNVQYEAGTLRAVAYDSNGKEISDTLGLDSVTTNSDKGTALKMEAEKEEILADGSSLSYISVDIVDEDGLFVSAARNNIRFTLTGNGTIVGVDNGNPSTLDKFQQKTVLTSGKTANIDAFSGKALVIVRSTNQSGGFKLNAVSSGLTGASVFVNTTGSNPGEAFLRDYEITDEYTITMGEDPKLQTEIIGIMNDGSTAKGTIEWKNVGEELYNTPGDHSIEGVLKIGSETISVSAYLHVKPIIVGVKNYSRATMAGIVPSLPSTVAGFLPDGSLYGAYPVTWEKLTAEELQTVGEIVIVNGTVAVEDGKTMQVKASIRVAETVAAESRNVAPEYATLTESCGDPADNLLSITDGVNNILNSPNDRWTNWNDHLLNPTPTITFTWNEVQEIAELKAWFFGDSNVTAPESVTILVSEDGENFEEVDFSHGTYVVNQENSLVLNEAQKAKALQIKMKQQDHTPDGTTSGYVGLTELEIWTTSSGYAAGKTAVLDTLTIDGSSVNGFVSGEFNENAYSVAEYSTDIEAVARNNAAVNILPVDDSDIVRIIVTSEDQTVTNIYKIQFLFVPPTEEQKKELSDTVTDAQTKAEADYTPESYAVFAEALKAAQTVMANPNASRQEVKEALKKLQQAAQALVKKSGNTGGNVTPPGNINPPVVNPPVVNPPAEQSFPKVGTTHKVSKASYKITASSAKGGTVTFVKPTSSKNTKFTVPASVTISGLTYKVTAIQKNAFKNNKKLTSVTIGKNVTSIGATAFSGAAKLKKITVKSTSLKKVGKNAFKGIKAKATINVPKAKLKTYKKLLKGKGQKSTVKIK